VCVIGTESRPMGYHYQLMTNARGGLLPDSAKMAIRDDQENSEQVPLMRTRSGHDLVAADTEGGHRLPKRCARCGGRYPADFRVCPRDAIPLEDAPEGADPMLGVCLAGTYEIVRMIGEGGMGRVYEARHARLPSKRFAVKLLHQELAQKPDVVARFQQEAEAVSGLVHPNVVSVHDLNHTLDGRPYIVAELLLGEELGCLLDRVGKLPASSAVHVARRVCRALAAAHARGIVHRDMKPENVFLCGNALLPSVKVLDFGISKVAESSHNLTQTGVVMGTPAYMAPEQARGDKVSERADIYAVGAILYRAVTGQKPFAGLDPMATLTAVLVDEPPRPCSLEPDLPPALELVIQRAMAKKPQERHASISELEAELAPFDPGSFGSEVAFLEPSEGARPEAVITSPGTTSSDSTARTMLAGGTAPSVTQAVVSATRSAKLARPAIVVQSAVGFVWFSAGLVDTLAAAIRMSSGDGTLSRAEIALTVVGALLALLTPAVLWGRHLKRQVWTSSPRSMEVASRLRRMLLLSVSAYGAVALFVHLLEGIARRDASGIAWPGWSIVMFLVALSVSAASWYGPGLVRRDG
jgi:serine/threonine protein kinase